MNADARTQFAAWIPEGDVGRFAKELPQRLKQDFAGTMKLLRNPDFQKLLLEYPAPKRTFLTTIEDKDVVIAETRTLRPVRQREITSMPSPAFVKANADKGRRALGLATAPKDWRPAVMDELAHAQSKWL